MTTTEASSLRRSELGAFLKACRGKVRPTDVGLPDGTRRRTSGLRREEVAMLAGVGVTWYTWLEQGRPINASTQVLESVARTLRLDMAQTRHLYQLAEATPMRRWAGTAVVPETVHAVLEALAPNPAVLVNGLLDVLAYNSGYGELFREWHTGRCVHQNLLWCCVTEPSARLKVAGYDEEVRHMVARVRAEYGAHVGDPEWEEDIRRLLEVSDEFAELWARHEVAEPQVRTRIYHIQPYRQLTFTGSELAVAACPGLRIQVQTPADDATRAILARLRPAGVGETVGA
ncbi:MAG TPA: helix-turn-helix transcriptional regulator [Pseudonocardiaceae bacterium]|nr:helix-turn-helix transcriptional regulator [Pseudonocardiaceae bacterium]